MMWPVILLMSLFGRPALARTHVDVTTLDGVIGPVMVKHIAESIKTAEQDSAACLVIEMDTPGGLLESTQLIIKSILASEVPVAVYIAPSGSGAGSAGVFITMSAHVAAMAPGTNIGAAHPVGIGGGIADSTMAKKIENFTASYIRTIAQRRGRNIEWAEKAVRESASITEREAADLRVIDFIAADLDSLLAKMDTLAVEVAHGKRTLHTKGAEVRRLEMGWRDTLLASLSNPNIAYLMMLLGFYGLFFELANPGAVFPGVIGGICLIVALFALQTLPINYAGLLLILIGLAMFIAEIKITSHGALTIGGIIATTLGSMMLIDSPYPFLRVSLRVIIPAVLATTAFFVFAVGFGLKAQRRKPTTGSQGLIGSAGVALSALTPQGHILVHGEQWAARSDQPIEKGEPVQVVGLTGLTLHVVRHRPKEV
ncbi:MAG: nodulation protein NfeD [Candidatus Latescibacteria bacterium]|nr:nodulation protein NfeD [Candidatus Latescibacterota bacterium]